MTTYVYDGSEVRLTGRTAVRSVGTPGSTTKRELKLVEICLVNGEFDWKKWVSLEHLYEIKSDQS